MLTKKTYKGLGIHFKLSKLACTLPFVWDVETERVSCTTHKKRQYIWFFNMITTLPPTFRLIQCFTLGIWNQDRSIALLALDFLYIIPYGMQIFFHWANIFHKTEVAHLLNAITSIDKKFTEIYSIKPTEKIEDIEEVITIGKKKKKSKKKEEETDGCDENVFASTFMMFVYSGLSVSLFLKHPENPRYLYSVIRSFFGLRQGEQILYYGWAVFEYFTLCKFCMTFNNVFYLLLLHAHSTNYWLKHLSCPDNENEEHENKKVVKQPKNLTEVLSIYKSEIVLNMHFNECCSQVFLPTFKILNILLHTMAIYVSISFWNVIPIGAFLIFPIGFVMWCKIEADVYPLLGRVNGLADSYRSSWEYKMRNNFGSRRQFAQMYPLGVKVSNAYTISKTTVLSLWAIIFNLVINCIVL